MNIIQMLRQFRKENKITTQQYKTFKGQVIHGDEIGCIKGLKRKHLITGEEADALILSYQLAYTE